MRGIRKLFGGTAALAGVDFEVDAGEIHGLLGENGAGKSTLIKVLAGAYSPDAGTVEVMGKLVEPLTASASRAAGVSFIHQDLGLVPDLSAAENIAFAVGFEQTSGPVKLISWKRVRRRAREVLARMGVAIDVDATVSSYGIGTQAAIAIARALATDARVLILDEPTATLGAGEVDYLFRILRRLRADGLGIVFVSHRMDEVTQLCDRVTVLRDGACVGTRRMAEVTAAEIGEMIVGRPPEVAGAEEEPRRHPREGQAALTLRQLEGVAVGPVNLEVPTGSVFGLVGLAGAGQDELAELIFGLQPPVGGEMLLFGQRHRPGDPRAAVKTGVGFVPADRADGLLPDGTLAQNLFESPSGFAFERPSHERGRAKPSLLEFDVRPPKPELELNALSGGNAQKLLLGKWFLREPRLLILNEPTAGVDIGARDQIHRMMRRMAGEKDMTIVVVSSDFEEVIAVCDAAAVLFRGKVGAQLERDDLSVAHLRKTAVHGE